MGKIVSYCIATTIYLALLVGCTESEPNPTIARAQSHKHSNLEVTSFGEHIAPPSLQLEVSKDSMDGWNIHIVTQNFEFAPEKANQAAVPGEGHAHIYVDNYKFARVYGPWYHLKTLTPGEHEIKVTLNAHDHSTWSHRGQAISTTVIIEQHKPL